MRTVSRSQGRFVDRDVRISRKNRPVCRLRSCDPESAHRLLQLNPGFTVGFAKLVLKYVEQQIIAEGKGIAVQNVSAKEIEDCTFPLPPEEERERIVAEVEKQFTRSDAGVSSLQCARHRLVRFRSELLNTAF